MPVRPTERPVDSDGPQALGRLADEVERLKRATPTADEGTQPRGDAEKGIGRAESVARAQADAIDQLLPAAGPARASLQRAAEAARKIRATPPPLPPRSR